MCGIAGTLPSSESAFFLKALNTLSHRGPDGYGTWHSDDHLVSFGHRRLAILDLSECGAQPMKCGHYTIVFNGEIYNFLEIREELLQSGFSFQSESDTEVIVNAYIKWGAACLHKFNGMWAFAIWDSLKKELFISRDRFGKKPFFYAITPKGKLVFASEMKAVLPFLPEIAPADHFDWCRKNIWLYEGTDKCLVKGISRFPAGHYAVYKPGDTTLQPIRFWDTKEHFVTVPDSYEDQVAAFRELLQDACKIRMRSDVPIGTALSGGIDSSAIMCVMKDVAKKGGMRLSENWQNAFVATFPGTRLDEQHYADAVINHLGVKADYTVVDFNTPPDTLGHYLGMFEELNQAVPLPMIQLYQNMRKKGVVVTIDGHGADELLGGYPPALDYLMADSLGNTGRLKKILAAKRNMLQEEGKANSGSLSKLFVKSAAMHYGKGFLHGLSKMGMFNNRLPLRNSPKMEGLSHFDSHLYDLFHATIMPTLLRNYDRFAMINGIEIRMPFLDHRVVSFLFSLQWESKYRNGFTKAILRDAVKDVLPPVIYNRKSKIGFNMPIVDSMKNGWKEWLLDTVQSQEFRQCTLINPKKAGTGIEQAIYSKEANFVTATRAWTDLTPFLWEKYFLKHYSAAAQAATRPLVTA